MKHAVIVECINIFSYKFKFKQGFGIEIPKNNNICHTENHMIKIQARFWN